jgi:hypothetical protein
MLRSGALLLPASEPGVPVSGIGRSGGNGTSGDTRRCCAHGPRLAAPENATRSLDPAWSSWSAARSAGAAVVAMAAGATEVSATEAAAGCHWVPPQKGPGVPA